MVIFGVDPGSISCGWGAIQIVHKQPKLLEYGTIEAKKFEKELPKRLGYIYSRILEKVKSCSPDVFVLESVFHAKNSQSLIKLSHARASAMLAGVNSGIDIIEYTPNEVKKSVTGKGHAGKQQVEFMVQKILRIKENKELFDATDALAVSLCHFYKGGKSSKSSSSNWKDFLKDNPYRIINS